ncbi:MAG: signal peptidase I [Azonexus sp.]|jgi:signal peptidase I|nr:signal peptidase I [Azonexus sp.]
MNFALILFILLVVTGVLYALNLRLKKLRPADAKEPLWVEWGADFFWVILIVFVLRSFVVEPFKIPSGSMTPTLLDGDFILVNKFIYGIRLPVIDKKIIAIGEPQRGDVMVFRYPVNPADNYIKRVIGVPGDTVTYDSKRLAINGQTVETTRLDDYSYKLFYAEQYAEKIGDTEHRLLNYSGYPAAVDSVGNFPYRENCTYNASGFTCTVPPGHYFMMGDNRDDSKDSRYWGFVPEENIVGKAFFIWLNFNLTFKDWFDVDINADLHRIGSFK